MKLNLGCGESKRPGYVNVDIAGRYDQKVDLSVYPWPWQDNTIYEVFCEHFLEHVEDFERTVMEVHRILQPGGTFHVIVPHKNSPLAFIPWHRYFFNYSGMWHCFDYIERFKFNDQRIFENHSCRMLLTEKTRWLEWIPNAFPRLWDYFNLPAYWLEWKGVKI